MGTTSVTFEGQKKPAGYSSALKIALVPTAPTIQEVSRVPSDDHLPGKPVTVTYRITSEANGPDDYALATDYDGGAAAAADAGLADPPTTSIIPNKDAEGKPTCGEGPCNLGATAATGPPPPDGTTITVPSDGVEGDAVNGISAGAIVVINQDYGNPYTVLSVADDGNTADIGLSSVPEGIVLGTRIAEQRTFQVVVSDVALLDPAASGAVSLAVTGTSADGTQTGQAPLAFTVTGTPIEPSYERYVRNLNNDRNPEAPGLDTKDPNFFQFDSSDGLNWYFKEAVSAKEGDKAEILIVMNAGNLADQTNITLNETLSPFVDYVSDSSKVDGKKLEDELDGTSPILNADGWTVTDGGEEEPENLIIAAHGSAHLTYQVTVGGEETVPGGEGGDVDLHLTPAEIKLACNGSNPESFDKDLCHLQPWVADNGVDVATNPVCSDRENYDGWQEGGNNPWVVGTATEFNIEAYDCRTKCAGKSGESFFHCAAVAWSDNDAANSTVCEVANQNKSLVGADGWRVAGEWSMYSFAYVSKCKHNKSNKNF